MSIMPGMENLAPERTETSSGSSASPITLPMAFSRRVRAPATSASRLGPPAGHVVPAGVGRDGEAGRHGRASTDVISARLAPLPPRRSLSSMGGCAWLWSKSKTYGIGPPCPGMANRVERRSLGGRFPTHSGAEIAQPTGPPPPSVVPGRPLLERGGPAIWRSKTSLASRMKSRTIASSSALKRWVTCFISSTMGCCACCSLFCAAGTSSTQTRRRSSVSRRRFTMPACLEPVEEEGHRPGGQPALLGAGRPSSAPGVRGCPGSACRSGST